jgi:hypothetical protein
MTIKIACAATAILAITATSAAAQDYAYADSHGNLVIDSAAGYKRILVGKGNDIDRVAKYLDRGQPKRDYYIYDDDRRHESFYRGCYQPGAFVKGRSYMYGLSDGEMPQLARCE